MHNMSTNVIRLADHKRTAAPALPNPPQAAAILIAYQLHMIALGYAVLASLMSSPE